MNNVTKYFTSKDAWVIAVILWRTDNRGPVDLSRIIEAGDVINHAIFTLRELQDGFYKGQKKGLFCIKNNEVVLSQTAIKIRDKIQKGGSGLFSIVENVEKALNSPRLKLHDIEDRRIDKCNFLTDENLSKAYREYIKQANKLIS